MFDGLYRYMTVYNGMYIVYDGLWSYIMVHYGLLQYFRVYHSIGWCIAKLQIQKLCMILGFEPSTSSIMTDRLNS